jgi:hypothetical protein
MFYIQDYFSEKKQDAELKLFQVNLDKDSEEILKRIIEKKYETRDIGEDSSTTYSDKKTIQNSVIKSDKLSGCFSEKFETKLTEDQIFNINNIIKNTKKSFNLKTEIKEDFVVKEYKKSEEVFVVDFDLENQAIEITAFMDYGFTKIDISETVVTKVFSGEKSFIRKLSNLYGFKYIFEISGKNIFYGKVQHEREIEFFKHILSFHKELGFNKVLKLKKKGIRQIKYFLDEN